MIRFLRHLFLFLLPLLILAGATEVYVRHLPNSYRIKYELMAQVKDSVEVLILGNSHAYSGIRPELLPVCAANIANVSQTLDVDRLLLERYAPTCPRLRHVVLVLDNSNLFDLPLHQTDEWFRCGYYRRYMHLGSYYRPRYWLELFHFQSVRGKIEKWRQQRHPDCTSLGWETDNTLAAKNMEEWNTTMVPRVLKRHTCQDWQQAEMNAAEVEAIVAYCYLHGLHLTLLATPVTPAYKAGIPLRQQQFLMKVRERCSQYETTRVIDLSEETTLSDNYYFDPDHLTHEGAAWLTGTLCRELYPTNSD